MTVAQPKRLPRATRAAIILALSIAAWAALLLGGAAAFRILS